LIKTFIIIKNLKEETDKAEDLYQNQIQKNQELNAVIQGLEEERRELSMQIIEVKDQFANIQDDFKL